MNFRVAKPQGILSEYVKQYWTLNSFCSQKEAYKHRIIPYGLLELTFYFGERPKLNSKTNSFEANAFLSGQQQTYFDIEISSPLSIFSISLWPIGASKLFKLPLNEITNRHIPIALIAKQKSNELEDKLYHADSFEERISITESFLLEQLKTNKNHTESERITHSIQHINKRKGLIEIEQLVSDACWSRKQFERNFAQYIGTSPKKFLRTIRFQNALFQKQRQQKIHLTELAYQCGYSDQAHMVHEFKNLTGLSPKAFFRESLFSDYFG